MVISIMNWKGGQGKTTTTFQLSHILSARGYRVLAVDLDGQGNLTMGLAGDKDISTFLPDYFIMPDKEHPLILEYNDKLHFIANERRKSTDAAGIMSGRGSRGEKVLKRLLDSVRDDYDVILVDCPPSFDILTQNALIASDRLLIPTELTKDSIEGMVSLVNVVKEIKDEHNPEIQISGVFKFRPKESTRYQRSALQFLESLIGDRLWKTAIRENIRVPESVAKRMPITEYDPKCNGALDFTALADELIQVENL